MGGRVEADEEFRGTEGMPRTRPPPPLVFQGPPVGRPLCPATLISNPTRRPQQVKANKLLLRSFSVRVDFRLRGTPVPHPDPTPTTPPGHILDGSCTCLHVSGRFRDFPLNQRNQHNMTAQWVAALSCATCKHTLSQWRIQRARGSGPPPLLCHDVGFLTLGPKLAPPSGPPFFDGRPNLGPPFQKSWIRLCSQPRKGFHWRLNIKRVLI